MNVFEQVKCPKGKATKISTYYMIWFLTCAISAYGLFVMIAKRDKKREKREAKTETHQRREDKKNHVKQRR